MILTVLLLKVTGTGCTERESDWRRKLYGLRRIRFGLALGADKRAGTDTPSSLDRE